MNSNEYWSQREDENTRLYQKDEKQVEREIEEIYQNTLDNVEKEIYSFYAKYASKEGITINEAKKRVTKADIEEYEKKAEKYVKLASQDRAKGTDANAHIYFSEKANEEMALYNLTMKVNRLEMLKSKIGLELAKGNAEIEAKMQKQLEKRSMEEMERQAGILGKSIKNQLKKAGEIVNGSFHNATFSDRIWTNQRLLKNKLDSLIQQGIMQGKGARQLASNIRKEFNVTTYQAERLMRTELARVQIETQKGSYIRNGFEEYEFIANSGCCDACQALNGKVFKVKKMMPGENAAPIHPNCRCSTAPYEDSEEYEAWLDYLSKGGTTEQYNEWIETGVNTMRNKEKQNDIDKKGLTIEDCKTSDDITRLFIEKNWYYDDYLPNGELFRGNKTIDFKGIPFEVAKEVYNSQNKIFTRYPKLIGRLNAFKFVKFENVPLLDPHRASHAADCLIGSGRGQVELNTGYFGVKNTNISETRQKSGFMSVTTFSGMVTHEYGHALDDYLSYGCKYAGYDRKGKPKLVSSYMRSKVMRKCGMTLKDIENEVSTYATKNEIEWFAECFAEYIESDNPRPVAREFGKQLEEIMLECEVL